VGAWRSAPQTAGCDRETSRIQRTTINGDYGLGYFENGGQRAAILEMTV
jgi:hypothetical protein